MEEKVRMKLAETLTADDPAIIPYLPYLLQDFWELGSSPQDMLQMLKKHMPINEEVRVLDLACGKGAVSVQLAKELGVHFKGVDLLPEFIEYAEGKSQEYGVSHLCDFEVADVNRSVEEERGYDCVIFGAVGDILGDYQETLRKLLPTIKKGGYILIDDAYVQDAADNKQLKFEKEYPSYDEWCEFFQELNLELIECNPSTEPACSQVEKEMNWITARADELISQYPDHKAMFKEYVVSQRNEYTDLQQDLVGAIWLLQKK